MTYSSLSVGGSAGAVAARSMRTRQGGLRFGGRGQNAVDFRGGRTRLGPVSNTVILIVLACLLGLLYLTQVTKTDAYGYRINELQTQARQLQTENENLQLSSAQMQSLDRVQHSPEATAMAPVTPAGTVKQ